MAELMFLILYIFCAVWEAVMMCRTKQYYGDAQMAYYDISNIQVIVYLIIYILIWITMYQIYKKRNYQKEKKWNYKIYISERKMGIFLFLITIILILYTEKTGVGVAGSSATSKFSVLFSMLDVAVVFPFYYVLFRNGKYRMLFWINISLFISLRILQGWTGFVIDIFLYELYFQIKRKNRKPNIGVAVVGIIIALIIGANFYRVLSPLKSAVRFNYSFNKNMILDFEDSLVALTSRISVFSRSAYALYNLQDIKKWYLYDGKLFQEIQSFFKPILPRFIMKDKEFMSLSESIFAAITNSYRSNASSGCGIVVYAIALFFCDSISWVIWIILLGIYFKLIRKLYACLEIDNEMMSILYFKFLIRLASTGSLEILFFQGEFKLIFIVPLLLMLGIMKIEKRKICNVIQSFKEIIKNTSAE